MSPYTNLATALVLGLLTLGADAAFKPPINNTLEPGVTTECKTCPYKLCTNKAYYDYNTQVSLTCWTRGTVIRGDSTWLRTSDDCYVTQFDLTEYSGDYITDLSYCGEESEEQNITYDQATVKYHSECNICPDNVSCQRFQYLNPGTDLNVTCWTADGQAVIDSTTWLKTTDNCYINQIHLEEPANKAVIDNCGPVGFIQINETGTQEPEGVARLSIPVPASGKANIKGAPWSHVLKRAASPAPEAEAEVEAEAEAALAPPLPAPLAESSAGLHKRFLINITVGEEYSACHEKPVGTSKVLKQYEFGEEVWMQCFEDVDTPIANETYWYKTTDFCFVREVEYFESLFDQYRFPNCLLFEVV